jgi:hypothetical protein
MFGMQVFAVLGLGDFNIFFPLQKPLILPTVIWFRSFDIIAGFKAISWKGMEYGGWVFYPFFLSGLDNFDRQLHCVLPASLRDPAP